MFNLQKLSLAERLAMLDRLPTDTRQALIEWAEERAAERSRLEASIRYVSKLLGICHGPQQH